MSYKVGDKVRIASAWGDGCHQNPEGAMDKYLGKVMTIKTVQPCNLTYRMYEDQQERVGGWVWNDNCIAGLARMESIHITTDGDKVIAVLKNGKEIVKRAEAKCSPRDTFDFAIGANLAYKRLMGEPIKATVGEERASTGKKPMTCREKLAIEHPEKIGSYAGGCKGCPHDYGYAEKQCDGHCRKCWDRLAEDKEQETQPKFKVGDVVRVNKYYSGYLLSEGDIATIIQDDGTSVPYKLKRNKDGECGWARPNYIDKVDIDTILQVGDLVQVVDAGRTYLNYKEWFENHAPEYVSKFKRAAMPQNGEAGVIKVIAPHDGRDDKADIYLIECARNRVFAIGKGGIEKM